MEITPNSSSRSCNKGYLISAAVLGVSLAVSGVALALILTHTSPLLGFIVLGGALSVGGMAVIAAIIMRCCSKSEGRTDSEISESDGGTTGKPEEMKQDDVPKVVENRVNVNDANIIITNEDVKEVQVKDIVPDINATDKKGRTALHYASQRDRNAEAVAELLEKMSDVAINATDKNGHTALHYATIGDGQYGGDAKVVAKLLKKMSNVVINATDRHGRTALHWAVQYGRVEVVEKLRKCKKLDINALNSFNCTALYCTVLKGNAIFVEELLKSTKIEVYIPGGMNMSALAWAKSNKNYLDKSSKTAQILAKLDNYIKIIKLLEEADE